MNHNFKNERLKSKEMILKKGVLRMKIMISYVVISKKQRVKCKGGESTSETGTVFH